MSTLWSARARARNERADDASDASRTRCDSKVSACIPERTCRVDVLAGRHRRSALRFVFVRPSGASRATVRNVVDTSRATVLGRDGARVSTTEHLLSALFAMGVTNAEIAVDGPEIPVARRKRPRVRRRHRRAAGVAEQDRRAARLDARAAVVVRDGGQTRCGVAAEAVPRALRRGFSAAGRHAVFSRAKSTRSVYRKRDSGRAHLRLSARNPGAARARAGAQAAVSRTRWYLLPRGRCSRCAGPTKPCVTKCST